MFRHPPSGLRCFGHCSVIDAAIAKLRERLISRYFLAECDSEQIGGLTVTKGSAQAIRAP